VYDEKEIPKFIADHMNGDIARWLRIAGFDCTYPHPDQTDDEILEAALREERILLTSDKELHSRALRKGIKSVDMNVYGIEAKMTKIFKELNIEHLYGVLSPRCTACNGELEKIYAMKVWHMLPPKVRRVHRYIYRCRSCGRLYWEGSHWKKIRETLRKVARNL